MNTGSEALPIVEVHCASWREFAAQYARDLKSGGIYVAHATALPLLSNVELCLSLPAAAEIRVRARVVHVMPTAHGDKPGAAAGLGLELELDEERKKRIAQLLEVASAQGDDTGPLNAAARKLLEAQTLPPPAPVGQATPATRAAARPPAWPSMPATARSQSSQSMPAARSVSQQLIEQHVTHNAPQFSGPPSAAPRRPSSSMPAVEELRARRYSGQYALARGLSQPIGPASTRPPASSSSSQELQPSAVDLASSPEGRTQSGQALRASVRPSGTATPAATDADKLKRVLSHIAHKHYEAALQLTHEMLADNPGDPQALRWQGICQARMALARGDAMAAHAHYVLVLQADSGNREALEYLRERVREKDKKKNSLFGSYFTKKK